MEKFLTLNTGNRMPIIGLGTWNAALNKVGAAVEYALLRAGYQHIDCAFVYHNEKEIGQAFRKIFTNDSIKREGIFITSKLWNTFHKRADVLKAYKDTLHDLQLDYLDLYLMHFGIAIGQRGTDDEPLDENSYILLDKTPLQETWGAMEELVKAGLVKQIGVSNFTAPMLLDLLSYANIIPSVNQIELHPYLQQQNLIEFCQHLNIAVTAYSPLGSPGGLKPDEPVLLDDQILQRIANEHSKTPAQILIRWAIERKTIPIPKSTTFERIQSNIEVFDFNLTKENLRGLNRKYRFVNPFDWWNVPYFD